MGVQIPALEGAILKAKRTHPDVPDILLATQQGQNLHGEDAD